MKKNIINNLGYFKTYFSVESIKVIQDKCEISEKYTRNPMLVTLLQWLVKHLFWHYQSINFHENFSPWKGKLPK